jgi:hypothetical protein
MSAASEVENIENNSSVESVESSYVTRVAASQTVIARRSVLIVTVGCLPKEFNGLLLHLLSNILLYTFDNYSSHPHRSSIFKWW